ncbi:hypothetical protein pb186bvf_016790 [Paramecium bursaria]
MSIQLDFENTEQLNVDFDDSSLTGQRLSQFFSVKDNLVTFKIPIEQSITLSQLIKNEQLRERGDYIPLLYVLEDLVDFYTSALDDGYYFNRISEDNIYFILKPKSQNNQQVIFNNQQLIDRNYLICIADAPSQVNGVLQAAFQEIIENTLRTFHKSLVKQLNKSRDDNLPEIVVRFIENMRYVTIQNQIVGFKRINEIILKKHFQTNPYGQPYELIFNYQAPQLKKYVQNDEINSRFYNYECQWIYQGISTFSQQNQQQKFSQNFQKYMNLLQCLERNQHYVNQDVPFIYFLQQQQYLNIYESNSKQEQSNMLVKYFEENLKIIYLYGYLVKKGILTYLQDNNQELDYCINELITAYVSEIGTMTKLFLNDTFIQILKEKKVQQNKFERDIKKVVIELVLSQQ